MDSALDFLRWDDYEDLKESVEMIRQAFDKPLLRVAEDDSLVGVYST